MPTNRLIPTLGLALLLVAPARGQDPGDAPVAAPAPGQVVPEAAAPPTEAEKLIDAAVAKVRAIPTVSADLLVNAEMLNQGFRLKGEYKRAPGFKLYLLLTLMGLGDATGTMLQVCDGETRWNFTKVLDSQHCTKLSMGRFLKILNNPGLDEVIRTDILDGMGFAGPDAMLAGLRKSFGFDAIREGTFQDKPVWILGGTWKDSKTPVLPGGNPVALGAPLPPYVPSLCYVYLGKEDGWPYQVVFEGRIPAQIERKKAEPLLDASGRPISQKLTAPAGKPSKIFLTYSNVNFQPDLSGDPFAFTPPKDLAPNDETDLMVSQLEQILTAQSAKKKADAAKGAPVLDGSVPAPSPEGAAKLPGDAPR